MGGADDRDFLDAITIVHILTASSFDVKPDKNPSVNFAWLL